MYIVVLMIMKIEQKKKGGADNKINSLDALCLLYEHHLIDDDA